MGYDGSHASCTVNSELQERFHCVAGDGEGRLPATDLPDFQDKVLPDSATESLQCIHGVQRIRFLLNTAHPLINQEEEGAMFV